LHLFGGSVITFGAMLVIIRFIQFKLKDPYQASSSTCYLSGYLTLSLNFFIGAEIIRTVATRTFSDFELLLSAIFSRGLFSLILYLEEEGIEQLKQNSISVYFLNGIGSHNVQILL